MTLYALGDRTTVCGSGNGRKASRCHYASPTREHSSGAIPGEESQTPSQIRELIAALVVGIVSQVSLRARNQAAIDQKSLPGDVSRHVTSRPPWIGLSMPAATNAEQKAARY
jgi:hypothetical protein